MKDIVKTDKAPAAIGPYSQAVKVVSKSLVFCSGQIPLDPITKQLVGQTAAEQCQQTMKNLNEILKAAGGSLKSVVKTTIYLSDLSEYGEVNEVYATFFETDPPARATVEASRLPMDVKVEIDAVAVIP